MAINKYNTNQYVKILDKLPPEIKDVIASSDTVQNIWKIGQKHNLHIDKLGIMSDTAYDVMMGIVSTKNFVKELAENLEISELEASSIVRDIDDEIFKPIKQTIVKLYDNGAPNRPSSSLVQFYEEDDNHPSLDKDALLKEIEEPVDAVVKKEMVTTTESLSDKKPSSLEGNKEEKSTAIEEYHEELTKPGNGLASELGSKEVKEETLHQPIIPPIDKLTPDNLAKSPTLKPNPTDLLNKIANIKLSKTFVMPKREDGKVVSELGSKEIGMQPISKPASVETSSAVPNKLTAPPTNNPAPNNPPAIDPYRERI